MCLCAAMCHEQGGAVGANSEAHLRVALMGADGSIVLGGRASGDWNGTSAGLDDFVAVKLDAAGKEIWRWQVRERDTKRRTGTTVEL